MFKTFLLLAVCIFSTNVLAQNVSPGFDLSNYGVTIQPDKRVMIVLATLEAARTTNAAGEDVPVISTPLSAEGIRFRELLKSDLVAMPADLRQKISLFVTTHKKRYPNLSDAELVAPFISMAYALTPAPELNDPVVMTELPGNLLDVLDFSPLVRDFYRRSSISGNINEYVKTYQKVADGRLRSSAREMVSEILTYLNTRPQTTVIERIKTETQKNKKTTLKSVGLRERERSFTLVPELLAPVSTVNFVNVKDEYFVVVPAELSAERDLSSSDVRRGFLQFVVDPLVYALGKEIETIRPTVKKLLEERRTVDPSTSPDVYLTISRSLVAAIDSREAEYVRIKAMTAQARSRVDNAKTDADKRAIVQELEKFKNSISDETALRMSEDYEKGSLLVFYFAEQLKGFEGSGFDIAPSLKEMILSFDGTKETDRLGQFAEARKRAAAAREERKKNPAASLIVESPVTNRLVEIQRLIESKNYAQAGTELRQLRDKNPNEPRIQYNLGRVASILAENESEAEPQKARLIEAKAAYEQVIKLAIQRIADLDRARRAVPADIAAVRRAEQNLVDRALLSKTYVALAKIHEFYDERIYALKIYEEAIKIGDVPEGAFSEALTAKSRLLKDQ